MNLFEDMIPQEQTDTTNPDYQANLFLIESAMRELGQTTQPTFQPSQYDEALMKLIDSVPRE